MASTQRDIARLFPDQGELTPSDYLLLTDHTNCLAEFIDGNLEVLPMPTIEHQRIVFFLLTLLRAFVDPPKLGEALMAPLRVKVAGKSFREPDIALILEPKASQQINRYWDGVDLVMEVVSEDDPKRDLVDKRQAYAEAGIAEYWIVDPRNQTITVLRLENGMYSTHAEASGKGTVRSALLQGFQAEVSAVFNAGLKK